MSLHLSTKLLFGSNKRLTPTAALQNLRIIEDTQRLLHSNVQEALALEVGMLKLNL